MNMDRLMERAIEKLDDISERLTRVETRIEQNNVQNEAEHNQLTSLFLELKSEVDDLRNGHNSQQSKIDKGVGRWQVVLAMIGGGLVVAIGNYLAKVFGLF